MILPLWVYGLHGFFLAMSGVNVLGIPGALSVDLWTFAHVRFCLYRLTVALFEQSFYGVFVGLVFRIGRKVLTVTLKINRVTFLVNPRKPKEGRRLRLFGGAHVDCVGIGKVLPCIIACAAASND